MYRVSSGDLSHFLLYSSHDIYHHAGYIEIALFQHGCTKNKLIKMINVIKDSSFKFPEFAPAAPMYKLIKGVIKATNENHDRYHYKPTGVISPFSSVSRRIKAAKLMFAPIMLQNHCHPLSSIRSPLCVEPTKLKFRPILLQKHLHSVSLFLCVLLSFAGRQLHVLSIWPLHRAAGFGHTKHHGGIRLVHLLHRHHVLSGLSGLRYQGNCAQLRQHAQST